MNIKKLEFTSKSKIPNTDETFDIKKEDSKLLLFENIEELTKLQDKLYADSKYSILLIFQGMDTCGKDSAVKHVMSGLNSQATKVVSFKQPSNEELKHDYLWRTSNHLPERGSIGIFNRSYYEDVLIVRVHNLLQGENIPQELIGKKIWDQRFKQIRNYEEYLFNNGIIPIKFFLNISKDEQKKRLLQRIDDKTKNWKFSTDDLKEREYWKEYQKCYIDAIKNTSTIDCPWYTIPADNKWFARYAISEIIVKKLIQLKLDYPRVSNEQLKVIEECKQKLINE